MENDKNVNAEEEGSDQKKAEVVGSGHGRSGGEELGRGEGQEEPGSPPENGGVEDIRGQIIELKRIRIVLTTKWTNLVAQGQGDTGEAKALFKQIEGINSLLSNLMASLPESQESWPQQMVLAQQEALEASQLGFPSIERAQEILREREADSTLTIRDKGDQRYHQVVKEWFEQIVMQLELSELPFEMESGIWTVLNSALLRLHSYDETRNLAADLAGQLRIRSAAKRASFQWKHSTPEAIHEISKLIGLDVLEGMFTIKVPDSGGRPRALIAEEYRAYERLGQELLELRRKLKETEGEDKEQIKKAIGKKEKEIIDRFQHGGKEDGKYVDEKLRNLVRKEVSDQKTKKEIERLRLKLWKARVAGGLWSITMRAAHYDLPNFNGLGDFSLARILNLQRAFRQSSFLRGTEAVWGDWDVLEQVDFMATLFGKVVDDKGICDLSKLKDWRVGVARTSSVLGKEEDGSADKEVLKGVDLSEAKLEDPEVWKELRHDYKVDEKAYETHCYYLKLAEETCKILRSRMGPLDVPTLENIMELITKAFENISATDEQYIEGKGKKRLKVSSLQRKAGEVVKRFAEWMRSPEGVFASPWGGVFAEADIYLLINGALKANKITEEQRDWLYWELYRVNSHAAASRKFMVSLITAPLRSHGYRGQIFWGALFDLLGKGLKYIFS